MICLSFHGLLFVGRTNRENSIPQKTASVISRRRQLACKRRHCSRIPEWTGEGRVEWRSAHVIGPVTFRPAFRTLSESPKTSQVGVADAGIKHLHKDIVRTQIMPLERKGRQWRVRRLRRIADCLNGFAFSKLCFPAVMLTARPFSADARDSGHLAVNRPCFVVPGIGTIHGLCASVPSHK